MIMFVFVSCNKSSDEETLAGIDMTGEYKLEKLECFSVDDTENWVAQRFAPYYSDSILIIENKFRNVVKYNNCKVQISGRIVVSSSNGDQSFGTANISGQTTSTSANDFCYIESIFQAGGDVVGRSLSTGPGYSYTVYNNDSEPDIEIEYTVRGSELLIRTNSYQTNFATDSCYFIYSKQ